MMASRSRSARSIAAGELRPRLGRRLVAAPASPETLVILLLVSFFSMWAPDEKGPGRTAGRSRRTRRRTHGATEGHSVLLCTKDTARLQTRTRQCAGGGE